MSVQIDRKEVYRYLGFRGVVPSRDIADKVEVYIKKLEEVSVPRSFCRYFPLLPAEDAQEEGGCVRFADLEIRSRNLAGNLRGCTQVCMLAVTIGIGADRLVSRAQLTDVAGAAICQAAGAAMPGMLAGGPNGNLEDPYAQSVLAGLAPALCYADNAQSYSTNEVAVYWNSPLICLMAPFIG